jgi:hypothetical protein
MITLVIAIYDGLNVQRFLRSIYSRSSYRKRIDKQLHRLGTSISEIFPEPEGSNSGEGDTASPNAEQATRDNPDG